MKTLIPHNTRQNPISMVPMLRLAAEVKEQFALLREAPELRYATFDYDPKVPALLRPPVEPAFPDMGTRWYSNGRRSFGMPATRVTYKPRPSMARVCAEINRRAEASLLAMWEKWANA